MDPRGGEHSFASGATSPPVRSCGPGRGETAFGHLSPASGHNLALSALPAPNFPAATLYHPASDRKVPVNLSRVLAVVAVVLFVLAALNSTAVDNPIAWGLAALAAAHAVP